MSRSSSRNYSLVFHELGWVNLARVIVIFLFMPEDETEGNITKLLQDFSFMASP